MNLSKTAGLSAFATAIKVISVFIISKVVTLNSGAEGLAYFGAFLNLINILQITALAGIGNGITKYLSDGKFQSFERRSQLLGSAVYIVIIADIVCVAALVLFRYQISEYLFRDSFFVNNILLLASSIVFISLQNIVPFILNGLRDITTYTYVNVVISFVQLVVVSTATYCFGLKGALIGLALSPIITTFLIISIVHKKHWFSLKLLKPSFDLEVLKRLSAFGVMALVSVVAVPCVQLFVRNEIISKIGLSEAGIWQGLIRISDGYSMLFTTAFTTYFLPKLSSINSNHLFKNEIRQGLKLLIPTLLILQLSIFFARDFIIEVLYVPSFHTMRELFIFQFVGDFFKLTAFLFAYIMLAKALVTTFIITEVIFSALLVFLTEVLLKINPTLHSVTLAYSLTYFLYLLVVIVICRKLNFDKL